MCSCVCSLHTVQFVKVLIRSPLQDHNNYSALIELGGVVDRERGGKGKEEDWQ